MKLVCSVATYEQYLIVKDKVNGIVIGNDNYAIRLPHSFNNEDIVKIASEALLAKKEVIIALNLMATNQDIERVKSYLKYLAGLHVKYLVQDLGVLQLLKEMNLVDRVIYDPSTMITNYEDLKFYLSLGINAAAISLEIPLADAIKMQAAVVGGTFYKVFGYHTMFHSKRKLISSYADFSNKTIIMDNYDAFLKEEKRDDRYHITEDKMGTCLYRSYVISMLKEIKSLLKMEYLFLDSIFIEIETFTKVMDIYTQAIYSNTSIEELIKQFDELGLETKDGFMYQDTVYLKEEF